MATQIIKRSTRELLNTTQHRPWDLPQSSWKFYQEWHHAVFFHWPVSAGELREMIPKELELDLYNEQAWVSLIVFGIRNIRPRYLPAIPVISDIDEINIRTYIKYKGKRGIYFFSLEANKWITCMLAKAFVKLPYRLSRIRSSQNIYSSYNRELGDTMHIEFKVKEENITASTFDRWLTERYASYQDNSAGKLNELEIHHFQWPLYKIELDKCFVRYSRFRNLIHDQPHLAHYSPGVQVLSWGLKNCGDHK
jgi:uncharacterized protein